MINLEDWVNDEEASVTPTETALASSINEGQYYPDNAITTNDSSLDWDKIKADMATVTKRIVEAKVDIAPTRNEHRNLAWAIQDAYGNSSEGYNLFLLISLLWSDPRGQTVGDIQREWHAYLVSNKYIGSHCSAGVSYRTFFSMAERKGIDIICNSN